MRLLFDQNLSPRLVDTLSDVYPGSIHAQAAGLDRATDEEVWTYARGNHLIIVTKDTDFHERSTILGVPPKGVWIHRGNCSTTSQDAVHRAPAPLRRSSTSTRIDTTA